MKGRYNVAYSDLNELAYPVLRHRMKMNFEAIASRVKPDDVIKMIIEELNGKKPEKAPSVAQPAAEAAGVAAAEAEQADNKKGKRKFFGRKE